MFFLIAFLPSQNISLQFSAQPNFVSKDKICASAYAITAISFFWSKQDDLPVLVNG